MGLEILREAEALGGDPDMIFVAIGGGGMIAGGRRVVGGTGPARCEGGRHGQGI